MAIYPLLAEEFGLGGVFSLWLSLLYRDQSVVIINEWVYSEAIQIKRGVRQGCPLSPLLCALALEPLTLNIRTNNDIKGFRTMGSNQRLLYTLTMCYVF